MDNNYRYFAFISYKREDVNWAKWLQKKLENYRIPVAIKNNFPNLPTSVRPVFRDSTDLSGGILEHEINEALGSSKYLIIICSPRAASSPWVCKEAQSFIDGGRMECIVPFIIEGEPNSPNIERECFPKVLRELSGSDELLGINVNEMGRDAAAIKVVARMLGVQFDLLWQRHNRDLSKRRRLVMSLLILLLIIISCTVISFYSKNRQLLISQSKYINKNIEKLIGEGDLYTASLLALEALPGNKRTPRRPYVLESEVLLRRIYNTLIETKYTPDTTIKWGIGPLSKRWCIIDSTNQILYKNIGVFHSDDNISDIAFSPSGDTIISSGNDNVIFWETKTGRRIKKVDLNFKGLSQINATLPNKILAVADNVLLSCNTKTAKIDTTVFGSSICNLSVYKDSIYVLEENGYLSVLDRQLQVNNKVDLIRKRGFSPVRVEKAAVSPDSTKLAFYYYHYFGLGNDGITEDNILIYDIKAGKLLNSTKSEGLQFSIQIDFIDNNHLYIMEYFELVNPDNAIELLGSYRDRLTFFNISSSHKEVVDTSFNLRSYNSSRTKFIQDNSLYNKKGSLIQEFVQLGKTPIFSYDSKYIASYISKDIILHRIGEQEAYQSLKYKCDTIADLLYNYNTESRDSLYRVLRISPKVEERKCNGLELVRRKHPLDEIIPWQGSSDIALINETTKDTLQLLRHKLALNEYRFYTKNKILTWDANDTLRIWRTDGTLLQSFKISGLYGKANATKNMYVSSDYHNVYLYDISAEKLLHKYSYEEYVRGVDFSQDWQWLFITKGSETHSEVEIINISDYKTDSIVEGDFISLSGDYLITQSNAKTNIWLFKEKILFQKVCLS